MPDLDNKIEELLRRTKKTTKSRYRASERLERHHKFSQWTVSFLSVALVFIPLMQAFDVDVGIESLYLNATQAILAVLILAYSLLLGQENFISRSEAMHRNGVELGRFARTLAAYKGKENVPDEEYHLLVEKYYDILEKYENHKPLDYLFTRLYYKPEKLSEWPEYCWVWVRAQIFRFFIYSHYIAVLGLVLFVFVTMFSAIHEQSTSNKPNKTDAVNSAIS
ncbi:SLATT domain-containing protein [Methylophaga thiooxydans]|uniref:SLATT domain-containing protein n=1 Tax=Methylophaga thiooxydans TaxID=392484 RepID=UPI0023555472|nr:SLATT domain-containing protein [Methylophaga thiooxydans]